jgi:hypothetical protein
MGKKLGQKENLHTMEMTRSSIRRNQFKKLNDERLTACLWGNALILVNFNKWILVF